MIDLTSAYFTDILRIANVFIAFFIMVVAFIFFEKTKPHQNRTPWILLFVAVALFFVLEFSALIFNIFTPIPELRDFFKTLFIAFILYVFIYQTYLLKNSDSIVIEKKNNESSAEQKTKQDKKA